MNDSTAINMSSDYRWSNNVSQFQCIKWIDARQPQTNRSQHGVKPVALGHLQATSAEEERRPVSKLRQKEYAGGRKMRSKQFICCCAKSVRATWADTSCKISSWPHGLIRDNEWSSEGVSGVTRIREGKGFIETFQSCNVQLAWNKW